MMFACLCGRETTGTTSVAGPACDLFDVLARTLFALLLTVGSARGGQNLTGVATVIDGDTIEIHGQRIRLEGIDAPESQQTCTRPNSEVWRCGQVAAMALSDYIRRAMIRCEASGTDRYGRTLATCFKDGEDLNRWLVSAGFAVAYRRYSLTYVEAEDRARLAELGVWTGEFEMPWSWRAEHRH
jgi:endonuclease YncB( thermonuclease family)